MLERNYSQVAFMPYAPIKESLQIGDYEVWPYYKESDKRIKQKAVIQQLNQIFGRYFEQKYDIEKGGYEEPLEEIFIISPTNFEIGKSKFSEEQIKDISSLSHIIAFCSINDSDLAFVSTSTDPFILYIQKFQVGSDGIRIGNRFFDTLDMVKFMKQYNLGTLFLKFEKTDLCDALGKALKFRNRPQIRRIFRSLELFYYTASRSEMVTNEHRLLSLVMCFEVLLNFGGKKIKFAKKIERLLDNFEPTIEIRTFEVKKKDTIINKDVKCSKTGWWAFDLYNLRSKIVHGDEIDWNIEKYGNIWTRIEFGGILLRKLIKKILLQEELWQSNRVDSIIEADSLDEKLESIVNDFKRVSFR